MSKENLNLPKTAFSMKANLPQKEPSLIDFWNKINAQALRNESLKKNNPHRNEPRKRRQE